MRGLCAAVLAVGAVGLAAGQPARPAPKVVEEDSKRVLVFVLGETADEVTVGDARYRFAPLGVHPPSKTVQVTYSITNVGKSAVEVRSAGLGSATAVAFDAGGDRLKGIKSLTSAGREIEPGKAQVTKRWYNAPADPKSAEVRFEVKAKGTDADVWRVVYPRKTWAKGEPPPKP